MRDTALDVARAFAAAVMVIGHTLDATLDTAVRTGPIAEQYWRYRGITAPLFLFVSGWAVVAATSRTGRAPRWSERWPRAALLLACGYLLRLPTWGWRELLAGSPEVWRHTLAFDALHVVGTSLALAGVLLALLGTSTRFAAGASLAALSIALPAQWIHDRLWGGPVWITQALSGGDAPFAIFPWAAYFFTGAAFGASLGSWTGRARTGVLVALALPLVAWGRAAGLDELGIPNLPQMGWRLGHVLLLLALASAVPSSLGRFAVPVGKRSLGLYLAHLPIVYGWGSTEGLAQRVGQSLPAPVSIGLGLVLLATSLGVVLAWERWMPVLAGLLRDSIRLARHRAAALFRPGEAPALPDVNEPTQGP